MNFDQPFIKLPIRFDAELLEQQVRALPDSAWVPHPTGYKGNEAVRLVTVAGQPRDEFEGPMGPTHHLARLPYVQQVMAELGGVWSRSRLMGLAPGGEVPLHVDMHYHWRTHVRIHIPVITNPKVLFTCGDETVHMAAGECWLFDSFRRHRVENAWSERRVHLVLDTVMTDPLRALIDVARRADGRREPRRLAADSAAPSELKFERFNVAPIMSPWEIRCHLEFLFDQVVDHPAIPGLKDRLDRFADSWGALWAQFRASREGVPAYQALIARCQSDIAEIAADRVTLTNRVPLRNAIDSLIFEPGLASAVVRADVASSGRRSPLMGESPIHTDQGTRSSRFDRPILIISPPRSGSTMLFEAMAQAPDLYTMGTESHIAIEGIPEFDPANRMWRSNRLDATDTQAPAARLLRDRFYEQLRDRDGKRPAGPVRMLEKTPKNALRISFFDALWPDSFFIYLYRDVRESLASMMEAWASGNFRTYPGLPGWSGYPWSLLLVPGWEQLRGQPLPVVVAHQWAITTQAILNDLAALPRERVRAVRYSDVVADPQTRVPALARSVSLEWDRELAPTLPLSTYTLSTPNADKWRRLENMIAPILPIVAEADDRARAFVDSLTV
jgi:hypothetical protein